MANKIGQRKTEHLKLALEALITPESLDGRFNYEPLLSAHPQNVDLSLKFVGKNLRAPLWVSSMTGGNKDAELINKRLATVANEFGLGMGLGSCRALLENKKCFSSFNLRPLLGKELPLYANLGLAQIEKLLKAKAQDKVEEMLDMIEADGLMIHINPLQEWLQPEGDRFERPALETLEEFLAKSKVNVIVKEVGQGFGPKSLNALLRMPIKAIEFAAFGGTNFSKLEILRSKEKTNFYNPLAYVGHHAQGMVDTLGQEMEKLGKKARTREFIISGGVNHFLDGHYLMLKMKPYSKACVYGQAGEMLRHAQVSEKELRHYVKAQLEGLKVARAFLELRE